MCAFGIAYYSKKETRPHVTQKPSWQTFVKNSNDEIAGYVSTNDELVKAKITNTNNSDNRSPASISSNKGYMLRGNRVLMGDINSQYENLDTPLEMINKVNNKWKESMGIDLMRFQDQSTKLMVKEELSIIKIIEGKGQYLEQVIITYLFKNGEKNSFKALVDSDTGLVIETWDRTVHERIQRDKERLRFPANNSDIITR